MDFKDMRKRVKRRGDAFGDPSADGIEFMTDGQENDYAASVDKGHKVDPRAQKIFIMVIILIVLYVFGLIVPKNIGNIMFALQHNLASGDQYSLSTFVNDIQRNVADLVAVLTGHADWASPGYAGSMLRNVVIALTGAGLAICGAVYQGSFGNALVSPSTLGVMSGGSFGLMLWVVLFMDQGMGLAWMSGALEDTGVTAPEGFWGYLSSSGGAAILSFLGCLLVVGLVLLALRIVGRGSTSAIMLIITGQVVGSVIGVVKQVVTYYYSVTDPYGNIAQYLQELQIASFWRSYTIVDIIAVGVPIIATFAVVMALSGKMTLLTFEEGEQRSMGVDTRLVQGLVVGLCTLLTAIIISFCGQVGFVGFLVPHLARRLVGPNFKYLLPAAAVIGAIFVLGAYILLLATVGGDYQNMVGTYITVFGSLVFIGTVLSGKGGARGTFGR